MAISVNMIYDDDTTRKSAITCVCIYMCVYVCICVYLYVLLLLYTFVAFVMYTFDRKTLSPSAFIIYYNNALKQFWNNRLLYSLITRGVLFSHYYRYYYSFIFSILLQISAAIYIIILYQRVNYNSEEIRANDIIIYIILYNCIVLHAHIYYNL
jgi:hypothetical protein